MEKSKVLMGKQLTFIFYVRDPLPIGCGFALDTFQNEVCATNLSYPQALPSYICIMDISMQPNIVPYIFIRLDIAKPSFLLLCRCHIRLTKKPS